MDGMFDLGPIFDAKLAIKLRDAAIEQVGENASTWWMKRAIDAIRVCARLYPEGFTTDEVWAALAEGADPHDGRAMGKAMVLANEMGIATPTDRYRRSTQVSCHGRPKRLWVGGNYEDRK